MEAISTSTNQASAADVDVVVARLRPRTVGEVIDQAFRLYRRHFLVMLAIVAVGNVPLTLLVVLLNSYIYSGLNYSGLTATTFGASSGSNNGLEQILLYVPGAALVIAMLAALTGGGISFKDAYKRLARVLPRVLGLLALHLVVWAVVYLPTLLATMSRSSSGFTVRGTTSLASSLAVVSSCLSLPYLIISIRLYLVLPALVAEDLGPVQAIRRSWGLTRNYWWRTFALSIVLGLLSSVITIAPQSVVVLLLVSVFHPDPMVSSVVSTTTSVVFSSIFVPVELLAIALYYIDQRVRKEGLDLESAIANRYPPVTSYAYAPLGYEVSWEEPYEERPSPNRVHRVRVDGQAE